MVQQTGWLSVSHTLLPNGTLCPFTVLTTLPYARGSQTLLSIESPERLVKAQSTGTHTYFDSIGFDGSPGIYFVNKFSGDAAAVGPNTRL